MKRSEFFKSVAGLIGVASSAKELAAIDLSITEVLPVSKPAATLGVINKCYVSAIDPILDTREINRMVTDVYNEDELMDILDVAGRYSPKNEKWFIRED